MQRINYLFLKQNIEMGFVKINARKKAYLKTAAKAMLINICYAFKTSKN